MNKPECGFDEGSLSRAAFRDSGLFIRLVVFLHTRKCTQCADLYAGYRKISTDFKSIKREKCPSSITDNVEKHIGIERNKRIISAGILDFIFYRPAYVLSGTIAVFLIAAVLTYQLTNLTAPPPVIYYTDIEIEKARDDLEKTMAIIYPVVQSAQTNFYEQIMQTQVLPPVRNSMQRTNQLFFTK